MCQKNLTSVDPTKNGLSIYHHVFLQNLSSCSSFQKSGSIKKNPKLFYDHSKPYLRQQLYVKDAISDWSVAKYFKWTCCFWIFMTFKLWVHTIQFICSFQTTQNNPISREGRIPQRMSKGTSDYPNRKCQSALILLSISFSYTIF